MSGGFVSLLRRHVAPPRFVLFAALLVGLLLLGLGAGMQVQVALLASFDLATFAFLVSTMPLFGHDAASMRVASGVNDANRAGLLGITVLVLAVVLVAIGTLVAYRGAVWFEVPLILGSLILAWIFANSIFALHYAHLYYLQAAGQDRAGLDFPNRPNPDYWDFFYFSFTLGMTFQTSDVVVSGAHMRRVVLVHAMAAFLFNIGILAFAINTVGGG